MAGATTAHRRRKIFPHLDKANKKKSEAESGAADKNGNGNGNSIDDSSISYDNAKSKFGKQHPSAAARKKASTNNTSGKATSDAAGSAMHHLLPLPLVLTVLICSGLFWIASFRDVMATGKPILDTLGRVLWGQDDADANFLVS